MRDNLLGYLLGALDAAEHEQVAQALQRHPHLRDELEKLRQHIEPLAEGRHEHEPPHGLARRTCLFIHEQTGVSAILASPDAPQEKISPDEEYSSEGKYRPEDAGVPGVSGILEESRAGEAVSGAGPSVERPRTAFTSSRGDYAGSAGGGWRTWDLASAALIVLAASMLFFPSLARSRHSAQLATCENHLRVLGTRLAMYCQLQGQGRFPYIPAGGNESFAGMYATLLDEHELLSDPSLLICPASSWADRIQEFRVPTRAQLREARGEQLRDLQKMGGGSYGYNVGFLSDGRHLAPRNQMRTRFAIMADAPLGPPECGRSENHGGSGLNILFEDGHVEYVLQCLDDRCSDHPLLNDDGLPEAGLGEHDSVVVRSEMAPLIRPVVLRP